MPVFKRYSDSYEKDGYYVHAPISDLDFPLPLQTPKVTEEIYKELGYKHGSNVPNELTWRLYDVGLHWTETTGPRNQPSNLSAEDLTDDGPPLTETDIETIDQLLDDYRGEFQNEVADLRSQLAAKLDGSKTTGRKFPTPPSNDGPEFSEAVEDLLQRWEPGGLIEDDEEPDTVMGVVSSTYRSDYRAEMARIPDLESRLRELEKHPWDVSSVGCVSANSKSDRVGLSSYFLIEDGLDVMAWWCEDYRGVENECDFRVGVDIPRRDYEFEIIDGFISDFATVVSHRSMEKFDVSGIAEWALEAEGQDPNEIMHVLVSDFSELVPMVDEFVNGFESYELESTDLGAHSLNLP